MAGAAALLAQLRPALDGPALQSLLVGYAQPGGAPATEVGAGTFRLGASAVGEVAAQPATLGFGIWGGPRWHATRTIVVRNVSTRRLRVSVSALARRRLGGAAFQVVPDHLSLRVGRAKKVRVTVTRVRSARPDRHRRDPGRAGRQRDAARSRGRSASGATRRTCFARVSLSEPSFTPSDTSPAMLTVQAGAVVRDDGIQIQPVSRLDILLYTASGRFVGVLARLRDLLPGSYSFGITGRGPSSAPLPPGRYELRLAAWPTLPKDAQPTRAQVGFRIE